MNKMAFVVILVLSVGIWFASRFIQAYLSYFFSSGGISFGAGCVATGYPIALCTNEYDRVQYLYYLFNIGFWFIVISMIWKALQKVFSKK